MVPAQPNVPSASASPDSEMEKKLCAAIRDRLVVSLLYDDDLFSRLFAPYGVYLSAKNQVLVVGTLIENPAEPSERFEPLHRALCKIASVTMTSYGFAADKRFDASDHRYLNGFICRV
jgi:hypothetical protein